MASEDITKLFPAMVGGDGPSSYSRNSSYQKEGTIAAKQMISEAVQDKLDLKVACFNASKTFRIVDFGCSAGPNTIIAVQNVMEALKIKCHDELHNCPPLEFQVFFNDHTNNDFNTLFRTLPSLKNYFAAGVPGNYCNRLFPKSTIHFAYSSYALHWISKIPKEIVDSTSPAWNKGSIQCSGFAKEVAIAYLAQFKSDLDLFLNARAQEIVCGGLMAIIICARPEEILTSHTYWGITIDLLGSCLIEMAQLGVISEEKVDSFNIPLYYPAVKELEETLKRNEYFSVERIDTLNNPMMNKKLGADFYGLHCMAAFDGLLKEHFGSENADEIIQYFFKKLSSSQVDEASSHPLNDTFILLKRNEMDI